MASLIYRENVYYLQYCVSGKARRRSLHTDSLQIAKEHLRQFESAQVRGIDSPLPSRTPIPKVLSRYVQYIRTVKTAKSAQTDVYYLREAFGPVCEVLRVTRWEWANKMPAPVRAFCLPIPTLGLSAIPAIFPKSTEGVVTYPCQTPLLKRRLHEDRVHARLRNS